MLSTVEYGKSNITLGPGPLTRPAQQQTLLYTRAQLFKALLA